MRFRLEADHEYERSRVIYDLKSGGILIAFCVAVLGGSKTRRGIYDSVRIVLFKTDSIKKFSRRWLYFFLCCPKNIKSPSSDILCQIYKNIQDIFKYYRYLQYCSYRKYRKKRKTMMSEIL